MSQFESVKDINQRINVLVAQLAETTLSSEELAELETLTRKLYERAIILNYKAKEEKVYGKEVNDTPAPTKQEEPVVEEVKVQVPVVEKPIEAKPEKVAKKPGEIQFDFSGGFDLGTKKEKVETPAATPQEEVVEEVAVSEPEVTMTDTPEVSNNGEEKSSYHKYFARAYAEEVKDRINTSKLTSIKGAIGLNDRMLYINELFNGNSDLFNQTINHLDNLEDNQKAIHELSELAVQHSWDIESPSVNEFAHLINRRYVD